MQTNLCPYDFCVGLPILRLRLTTVYHNVLNVEALVGNFNQEKARVTSDNLRLKLYAVATSCWHSTVHFSLYDLLASLQAFAQNSATLQLLKVSHIKAAFRHSH